MPPKQRITREMILDKSFAMFRNEGMEAVNARSIAKALNCSTQPIFSYFAGMEDLKQALDQRARDSFEESIAYRAEGNIPLVDACNAYVRFAGEHPRLFAYLFMRSGAKVTSAPVSKEMHMTLASQESEICGLSAEQAKELCLSLWVYAHGLATACAAGIVSLSDECVSRTLDRLHKGEVTRIKSSAVA